MKSTWLLVVGIAIGALGSGTYFATTERSIGGSVESARNESAPRNYQSGREHRREFRPLWNPHRGSKSKAVSNRAATADTEPTEEASDRNTEPSKAVTRPLVRNMPRLSPGDDSLSEEDLAELAAQIESRANRELDRLSRLLDLSEEQQNRIFPLLARSSTAFHPTLAVQVGEAETSNVTNLPDGAEPTDGSSGGSPSSAPAPEPAPEPSEPLLAKEADQEIHDILTEQQQQALEDELVDEDLWWSDIVEDLEDELDESTEVADEEDTGYEGNTGIGSLLQQAAETESENE